MQRAVPPAASCKVDGVLTLWSRVCCSCCAVKLGERQSQKLTLSNPSPDRDACYKIKTTCVARYAVLPGQALIPAGATAEVEIVLIKMDELPGKNDLRDRFLIQAAWKDDPAEEVQAFWKRGPKKDELYQKKFSSELFLPDETEEQKAEERQELAVEMLEESVQEVETAAANADAAAAKYDTNNDGVLDEAELEAAAKAEREAKAAAEAKAKADAEAQAAKEEAEALAEAEERYQQEQQAKREAEEELARKQAEEDAIKAQETQAKNAAKAKAKQARIEAERAEAEKAAALQAELEAKEAAEAATRDRSPSSAGPSLAMQLSLPEFGLLTSDPIKCLSEYSAPLNAKLATTPLKGLIDQAAEAAGVPQGLVVFAAASVTLLLMVVFAGLSAVTTILGLLLPAVWTLQMLCTGLDASAATAMPLYWIIFTGLLMLEDIGLTAWIPLYWLFKPLALISLWGFHGAEMLFALVSK